MTFLKTAQQGTYKETDIAGNPSKSCLLTYLVSNSIVVVVVVFAYIVKTQLRTCKSVKSTRHTLRCYVLGCPCIKACQATWPRTRHSLHNVHKAPCWVRTYYMAVHASRHVKQHCPKKGTLYINRGRVSGLLLVSRISRCRLSSVS